MGNFREKKTKFRDSADFRGKTKRLEPRKTVIPNR